MIERPEDQEQNTPPEPTGLPADLFDDPVKYDGDIPLWKRTVNLMRQFEIAKPKKQNSLLENTAASIISNPRNLELFVNNLNLVSDLQPEMRSQEFKNRLVIHLERSVARRADLQRWSPRRIEELIQLSVDSSGELKQVVEKLEAALFNAPRTIEEAVDLAYNASWVMVSTSDDRAREELYSIQCYTKPWYLAEAESAARYESGFISGDDLHLARYHSTEFALNQVGQFLEMGRLYRPSINSNLFGRIINLDPPKLIRRNAQTEEIPDYVLEELMNIQAQKNPIRVDKLVHFSPINVRQMISDTEEKLQIPIWMAAGIVYKDISKQPWPVNVIENPNEPLRKYIMESFHPILFKKIWEHQKKDLIEKGFVRLTEPPLQVSDTLFFDIMAQNCESQEQRDAIVRIVYEQVNKNHVKTKGRSSFDENLIYLEVDESEAINQFFSGELCKFPDRDDVIFALIRATSEGETVGRLASVIEYHRPLISAIDLEEVNDQLDTIRKDLNIRFSRSVGRRGYEVVVADPILRQLGYQFIRFIQEGQNIRSIVNISGEDYEFFIAANYKIIKGGDVERFENPTAQAWLELLSLSHLKKLMCTEEDSMSDEMVGGKKQHEYYRKQKVGRIEHLRRLPPGQNFSSDAYLKCLKSDLPVNQLDRINKMRAERGFGGTKETGMWTYISGVERDIDTGQAKPVKISFATATDDMRKVIPLGEISQEELDRIEKEILSELEIT